MKVFISWSGKSSKAIASALREWLPLVIQSIEPWMSDEDIDKGQRWRIILDKELSTDVGIICLTPNNLNAPFILFEAGAIAKSVEKSYACTYLYHLKPGDIGEPLSAFQHTMAKKDDTKKLIETLNKALKDQALSDKVIETVFENLWPVLEKKLNSIPQESGEAEPKRSPDEKIDEILLTVRNLQSVQNKTINEEDDLQTAANNIYRIAKHSEDTRNLLNIMRFGELIPNATESPSGKVVGVIRKGVHKTPQVLPKGFFPDKKTSK